MNRTFRALAVTAAGAALVLSACSGTQPDTTETTTAPAPATSAAASGELTIGLTYTPDIQFAPFYLAEANGYYEETGVEVTLRHHGQSESLFGALASGDEDLIVVGGDEMLQARSQDVDVVSVATLYQEYPVVLIVPEDSAITTAADLAGHSVGLPGPFGQTHFGLLALLASAGLSEDDVDVQHIGFTQQAALTAGHVDAVIGFANNDAVQFELAGLPVRTIPLAPAGVPLQGIGIGAADAVLETDEEAVAAVVAATLRAVGDIITDPQAAVEASVDYIPGLSSPQQQAAALATLEATIPLYGPVETLGTSDQEQWAQMADFMAAHDLLGGEVDVSQAVRTDLLPQD